MYFEGMPDCERLSMQERAAVFAKRTVARYVTFQLSQIIPRDFCEEQGILPVQPAYVDNGCSQLEVYANFPEI